MPKPPALAPINRLSPIGLVAFSALFLVLVAGLLNWTSIGLDNDPYYHLNAGRYIVDQHELPHESFFSYLDPPRSWIDYYWLFQTVAYLTQRALGDYGLVLLRALAVLTTLGLIAAVFEFKRREQGHHPPIASILTVAFVALYALALLPRFASIRPHISTLLAITLCLFILECLRGKEWLLVIVTLTWMNFHGIAYPIMLLVVGSYVVEIGVRWIRERRLWTGPERTALLWMFTAMAMVLITPHGVALLALPFRSIAVASRYILEIRPVDPSTLFEWSVGVDGIAPQTALNLLRPAAAIAAIVFALRRKLRISHSLLFVGGLVLLIKGARFEYHLTLLALPLVATMAVNWHDKTSRSRVATAIAGAVVLLGAFSAFTYFRQQSELIRPYGAHGAPRGVARFLHEAGEGGRILHHPNLGGYLAWKLHPDFEITADMQTPFVFSNLDVLHSVKVFNNEMLLRRALTDYRQQYIVAPLGNFGFSKHITERAGFVPVFFDEISALYVNRQALPDVARAHEIHRLDLKRNLIDQVAEMDRDQARSALEEIERMLRLDPDGGLLHVLASGACLRAGDAVAALDHAEKATDRLPGSHQAHAAAAAAHFATERWRAAAVEYRRAIAHASDDKARPYYRQLARCLAQLKEFKKGYRAMLRAVDVLSSDTSRADLFELGLSARSAGKPDEARDYLSFALSQTPPGDTQWRERIEQALATVAREK